jgi:hypothetical protein
VRAGSHRPATEEFCRISEADEEPLGLAAAAELGSAFLDPLLADFAAHGAEAIRRCREDSPALHDGELDRRIRPLFLRD